MRQRCPECEVPCAAVVQLREHVVGLDHRIRERAVADDRALGLAREIDDAKLLSIERRVAVLEASTEKQNLRMALWAGIAAGISFVIGRTLQ